MSQPDQSVASPMLDARQAAEFLGVKLRTLYDLGIPCYKYGRRCTRWAQSDLEEYKAKCRFTSTKPKDVGVFLSAVEFTASVTSLRSSFQKAGAKIKPKPLTAKSARIYSLSPQE